MDPQYQSGVKTWQWVVTVIVIIVLIIIGIMVFGSKKSEAPVITEQTATTTESGAINRIVMNDQYPGNVVYLSSVQVSSPAWVVIQTDKNGTPDKIIGSAHFAAGINPGKITLTQPIVDGGTYYAVIYTDDASGKFSATADQPLKDANGNVIMRVFRASTSVGASLKG